MLNQLYEKVPNKIRWGYLTAFILLLSSYILSFYTTKNFLNESEKSDHTNKVINHLDLLLSSIIDGESCVRGYYITGNPTFVDHFYKSPKTTDSLYQILKNLITHNSLESKLDSINTKIEARYFMLKSGLQFYKERNNNITDSLKGVVIQGNFLIENIRKTVVDMQGSERALMLDKEKQSRNFYDIIKIINILSLIVAISLAFYSMITFTTDNRAKQRADQKAADFSRQLELRILELNQLNSQLIELKSIEKFASTGRIARTIAHEVRNPLTNINLATEHIRGEIPANSETDLILEMITRNSNRINLLISDLLNSTKASQLEFQSMTLNTLIDESLELAQDRIELKGIKVIKEYDAALPLIYVDPAKIKIAFLNVIVNAIEAMQPQSGVLTIKTTHKNNRCIALITDNGKGMNNEELTNLFEPYFTTKENGSGLGLTNTQNIILSHKANITAESQPGIGTTFKISFNDQVKS